MEHHDYTDCPETTNMAESTHSDPVPAYNDGSTAASSQFPFKPLPFPTRMISLPQYFEPIERPSSLANSMHESCSIPDDSYRGVATASQSSCWAQKPFSLLSAVKEPDFLLASHDRQGQRPGTPKSSLPDISQRVVSPPSSPPSQNNNMCTAQPLDRAAVHEMISSSLMDIAGDDEPWYEQQNQYQPISSSLSENHLLADDGDTFDNDPFCDPLFLLDEIVGR
jgi:hypothetical protein